jgi:hypothetical protein
MEPPKRIVPLSLLGTIVLAPAALELACSNMDVHEFYAPVTCEKSAKYFRAPYRRSCDLLVERAFPPHNHENNSDDDAPSVAIAISASGNSTVNVVALGSSVLFPVDYFDGSDFEAKE